MATEKFWIVWSPPTGTNRYRHTTKESAVMEAIRLASSCSEEFFVCEIVGVAQRVRAEYECIH